MKKAVAKTATQKIDDGDMGFHAHIGAKLMERDRLTQMAQQIQSDLLEIQGGLSSWSKYLTEKYGLMDGDRVDEDGSIVHPDGPAESVSDA